MSDSIERELGRLESQLSQLEHEMRTLQTDVREIRDALVSFKGGWRALALIAAASATLGALFAKIPFSAFLR